MSESRVVFGCEAHRPQTLLDQKIICVADMLDDERDKYINSLEDSEYKKDILNYQESGYFKKCSESNLCKVDKEQQKDNLIADQEKRINELQDIVSKHNELLKRIVQYLNLN